MNKDFLRAAFSKEEQAAILVTNNDNGSDQKKTQDQLFILSEDEYRNYHSQQPVGWYYCELTPYAETHNTMSSYYQDWWLRYSEKGLDKAQYIGLYNRRIMSNHSRPNAHGTAVRPVLWIDFNSDYFNP